MDQVTYQHRDELAQRLFSKNYNELEADELKKFTDMIVPIRVHGSVIGHFVIGGGTGNVGSDGTS